MKRIMTDEFYRMTVLCVDSYEKGVPIGRFYNPGCGGCFAFHGLTQFLIEMDGMLDEISFPQSFNAVRSFARCGEVSRTWNQEELIQQGELATFSIRILFRQNASWQGSVKWLEGGGEQSFRSVLELIFLIDSVLSDMDNEQAG